MPDTEYTRDDAMRVREACQYRDGSLRIGQIGADVSACEESFDRILARLEAKPPTDDVVREGDEPRVMNVCEAHDSRHAEMFPGKPTQAAFDRILARLAAAERPPVPCHLCGGEGGDGYGTCPVCHGAEREAIDTSTPAATCDDAPTISEVSTRVSVDTSAEPREAVGAGAMDEVREALRRIAEDARRRYMPLPLTDFIIATGRVNDDEAAITAVVDANERLTERYVTNTAEESFAALRDRLTAVVDDVSRLTRENERLTAEMRNRITRCPACGEECWSGTTMDAVSAALKDPAFIRVPRAVLERLRRIIDGTEVAHVWLNAPSKPEETPLSILDDLLRKYGCTDEGAL